jgi:hypothetical protein
MHDYEFEIKQLHPTPEEIDEYINMLDKTYSGVPYGEVTYSTYDKYRGGNGYFISFHDNHGQHKHYHIDVGYVNFDYKYNNITHLMLDKDNAPGFISFIKEIRRGKLLDI